MTPPPAPASPASPNSPNSPGLAWILAPLLLVASAVGLVILRQTPPSPRAEGPGFSALAAAEELRSLPAAGEPRPIGSEANARFREGLVAALRERGLEPRVKTAPICTSSGTCGTVHNVHATIRGREPGPGLLLAANYDTMLDSPGASDSATGAAVLLEVTRKIAASGAPRRDLHVLFTDGEDAGMLGARAFAQRPEFAKEVAAAMTIEGGGLSGPSLLMDAAPSPGWFVRHLGRGSDRPIASSAISAANTLYSDFSEFEQASAAGGVFVHVGGGRLIFTERDTLERVDLATMQHQGDNVLGVARSMLEDDLGNRPASDAVYFDLFAFHLVRVAPATQLALAALSVLLLAAATAVAARKRLARLRDVALGAGIWLGAALLCAGAGVGLTAALGLAGARRTANVAFEEPALVCALAVPLAILAALAAFPKRERTPGLHLGAWWMNAAIGVALGALAPPYAYVFVAPSLVAGALALAHAFGSRGAASAFRAVTFAGPAWLQLGLVASLLWAAKDVFGLQGFPVYATAMGVALAGALALFVEATPARRAVVPLAALLVAGAAMVGLRFAPQSTPERPEPLILFAHRHAEGDRIDDRWLAAGRPLVPIHKSDLAPEILERTAFSDAPIAAFPWLPPVALVSSAPTFDFPVVEALDVQQRTDGDLRTVSFRLVSPRSAERAMVLFGPEVRIHEVKIDGQVVPEPRSSIREELRGHTLYRMVTLSREGARYEVTVKGTEPFDAYLLDQSRHMPASGRDLLRFRRPTQMAVHDGDGSFTTRKVRL